MECFSLQVILPRCGKISYELRNQKERDTDKNKSEYLLHHYHYYHYASRLLLIIILFLILLPVLARVRDSLLPLAFSTPI